MMRRLETVSSRGARIGVAVLLLLAGAMQPVLASCEGVAGCLVRLG